MNLNRQFWIAWAALLLPLGGARAHADSYALLIGIDKYDHGLTPLGGAANDARALAQTLIDVCKFPAGNVTVLVSDDKPAARGPEQPAPTLRPDRNGILQALTLLTKRVKTGDLVFLFYAGHGVQPDSTPYLLPEDCLDDEQNMTDSALPVTVFGQRLANLKAKTLIMAFDMCRSIPFGGTRDVTPDNHLSDSQVRGVQLAFQQPQANRDSPLSTIMLFACSPKESSYEWREKKRGYFSYFLEQGLRCDGAEGGASDSQGVVKVEYLVKYMQKAVPGAIQLHETRSITQTPYPNVEGPDAMQTVLATDRPHQSAGETAVPRVVGASLDDHFNSIFQRGVELMEAKQYERAEAKFEDALELKPNSAWAMLQLGLANEYLRKYEVAEKLFRRAMDLAPAYAAPVNNLGALCYRVKHDYVEAEKYYQKAMELDPTLAVPVYNLGGLCMEVKHDDVGAERLFRKAMQLDPKDADSVADLGMLYYEVKHDYAEAEKLYRKAIALDPKDAHPVYYLGLLYKNMKHEYVEAEKLFRKAMELDSNYTNPVICLGNLYSDVKHDYVVAEKYYRQAIELDPKDAVSVSNLGILYTDVKHDNVEAERLYRKAILLAPGEGAYHADLAESLLKQGKRGEAKTEAQKAISLRYKEKHPAFDELGIKP